MRNKDKEKKKKAEADERSTLMQDRAERSRLAAQDAREKRLASPRGVDRAPESQRLSVENNSKGEVLIEHTDASYRDRRVRAQGTGRRMRGGMNQQYFNPKRWERKAAQRAARRRS